MADPALQAAYKPMSVKEIASKAQDFEFDPHIALKYWFRTADALIKEVTKSGIRTVSFTDCLSSAGPYL